jgi:hypothetical protein
MGQPRESTVIENMVSLKIAPNSQVPINFSLAHLQERSLKIPLCALFIYSTNKCGKQRSQRKLGRGKKDYKKEMDV